MPDYDGLKDHKLQLMRKFRKGSVFLAPMSAAVLASITNLTTGGLLALVTGYKDLGVLTTDGAQFSGDVQSDDSTSWGYTTPTRSDIISDTTTMQVTAQETKLLTIEAFVGADLSAATPTAGGEIVITVPSVRPEKTYRLLALGVDSDDGGEFYIGRHLAKAKVTARGDQVMNGGLATYPLTFTAQFDSTAGFAERWFFGGPGWKARLVSMGFPAAP